MFEALGALAPDFKVDLRAEFGAANDGHRAAIRASLARILGDPSLTDLATLPAPAAWSISISHATPLGGWLAVPSPAVVGFDLEVRDRVREPTVRRICRQDELALTDDLAALWCAKEALFKATARGRTATLGQLRITGWTQSAELIRFEGENGAHGAVESGPDLAAAWAISTPGGHVSHAT